MPQLELTPDLLYRLFTAEMESEGIDFREWDELTPNEQIGWGKFFRSLQRSYGLPGHTNRMFEERKP